MANFARVREGGRSPVFNIIDAVKGVITPEITEKLGSLTGDGTAATSSAFASIIPAIGAGLIQKGATAEGASDLIGLADRSGLSNAQIGSFGSTLSDPAAVQTIGGGGRSLISSLFGSKLGAITDLLSSRSGVSSRSSGILMSLLAPVALSLIGKHARENNLSAGGLSSMFSSQLGSLSSILPKGLGDILGLGSGQRVADVRAEPTVVRETGRARDDTLRVSEPLVQRRAGLPPAKKSVWPLAAAVAAVGALLLLVLPRLGRNNEEPSPADNRPEAQGRASPNPRIARTRDIAGSLGDSLQRGEPSPVLLGDSDFRAGTGALSAQGQSDLNNVARVLSRFPSATVLISGGSTDANARASSIREGLVQAGVDASRLSMAPAGEGPAQLNVTPK
jgi:outer membrane protein OmpA-like peptidoglycan-associated protein